ncbi:MULTISPECIES: RNA-directed DNA polymerase [unclassified Moraxella]|uniref:RNA-directed DNA polymerase n=1 Tax=unclassified Moraxella TaxID=2685852 RepID=UPI00359CE7B4
MSKSYTLVLELDANDAHDFFLKTDSYCNLSLPPYFNFSELLNKLSKVIKKQPLSLFLGEPARSDMADTMDLNHIIYGNKGSNLSWRPLQLIHPLAYLALVNVLTQENNWKKIQNRFKKLSSLSNVSCLSIPIANSTRKNSNKGEQILQWWTGIEQKSIALSLEYDYMFSTDVADCYSSIYTHSLAWAIDGIKLAKTRNYREDKDISGKNKKFYLGSKIDRCIQQMQNRQTNGIPQGSVLMDFIAEILFNYLDFLLTLEIKKQNINRDNYAILRYRDDYRIFVKNKADGEKIIKILSGLLRTFGLKLNENKTFGSNDIISNSIKQDKIPSLEIIFNEKMGLQKKLLVLREHSKKYPNAGSIFRLLKHLRETADLEEFAINYEVAISILLDIGIHNPKLVSNACAFISDLLPLVDNAEHIKGLIFNKLSKIPNSGLSQIWLQRILKDNLQSYVFNEKLCHQVDKNKFPSDLWNISWLPNGNKGDKIKQIMGSTPIICWETFNKLSEIVSSDEVNIMTISL